jgi:hypothetical protein
MRRTSSEDVLDFAGYTGFSLYSGHYSSRYESDLEVLGLVLGDLQPRFSTLTVNNLAEDNNENLALR